MTSSRRMFTVVVPDWGQGCLSSEAIAAYADNELAAGPRQRAESHLGQCLDCAAQVRVQGQASNALSSAGGPCMSASLMSALRSIPLDTDLPGPPTGLAMSPDGEVVEVLRPEAFPQPRRTGPGQVPAQRQAHPQPHRRMLIGAGAAVSGLAIGALAFGVTGFLAAAPAAQPDRGILGGAVLGTSPLRGGAPVDARLSFPSTGGTELQTRLEQVAHSYLIHP